MKKIILLFSMLLGIFYFYLLEVSISNITHSTKNSSEFSFTLKSHIDQDVKLHISSQYYQLLTLNANNTQIIFPTKKMLWFESAAEEVFISLKKGENSFVVTTNNNHKDFKPSVKQKITNVDYFVLFILLGIPVFYIIFNIFIYLLDKVTYRPSLNTTKEEIKVKETTYLLFGVLGLGVLVRVLYFSQFGVWHFQHDWHGHIEFIKYIASNWSLPLPSKGLEFPQQPLYYLLTGGLYALLSSFGINENEILRGIGYFSLFCSIVFLYYSYRFVSLLTQSKWVQTVAMIFLSLTPSVVYLSARINNDTLVMALSSFTLYHILKSYKSEFKTGFYMALLGVSLLFMTKISAASMELLLFALLIITYLNAKQKRVLTSQNEMKKRLFIFGALGVFLLGFTLLRVYLPIEGTFHMVNSSSYYPNQSLKNMDYSYFTTFNIVALLDTGYSYVFGVNSIRHSFFTYQYGTMFFGEFDYAYLFAKNVYVLTVMKTVLFSGLIYLLGFVFYIIQVHKRVLFEKLLFAALFINFLLIMKFMLAYTVICNTDFRYFVPSFIILASIFAHGLYYLRSIKWIWIVINIALGILVLSELLFFYAIDYNVT